MSMPSQTGPRIRTKCWQPVNARRRRNTLGRASSNVDTFPAFALFPRSWCQPMVSQAKGSDDLAEETITPARREVGETLLRSSWICQCPHEHCHCQSQHPPLSPRISHPDEQNVQSPSAVGGQSRSWAIPTLRPQQTSFGRHTTATATT
jgi:hypothetical protein